jgi:hypothetical protein
MAGATHQENDGVKASGDLQSNRPVRRLRLLFLGVSDQSSFCFRLAPTRRCVTWCFVCSELPRPRSRTAQSCNVLRPSPSASRAALAPHPDHVASVTAWADGARPANQHTAAQRSADPQKQHAHTHAHIHTRSFAHTYSYTACRSCSCPSPPPVRGVPPVASVTCAFSKLERVRACPEREQGST